jgi:hypothetical protein
MYLAAVDLRLLKGYSPVLQPGEGVQQAGLACSNKPNSHRKRVCFQVDRRHPSNYRKYVGVCARALRYQRAPKT